jgi:DNA topoisomerase-1
MNKLTNYFLLKQFYLFHDLEHDQSSVQSTGLVQTQGSTLVQTGGKNNKKRWDKLHHKGPLFPDEYQPHKVPIIFKKEKIVLPTEAEEFATIYSKYIDSEYIKNKKFNKNFWNDWSKYLKNTKITNLEDCDFSLIKKHVLEQKEKKMLLSSEEKQKMLEGKKIQEEPYLHAMIDGKKEKIGNFRIEPPGIFIGRGCHPLLGSIKPRLTPSDVILNLSKDAPIPNSPLGNKWSEIIHNQYVDWLASYPDNISGKTKYIWLSASSSWKMENDKEKFDLARKLKRKIKEIRSKYNELLTSKDLDLKQLATCIYFIDYLALRVGNEKGEEEADTVGITSLRVEHISLMDDLHIKLDFLGKDSVRFVKVIKVNEQVYNNLVEFIKNKSKSDDIFDKINTNDINKYLQSLMEDLTAKVFRTFNASSLFNYELNNVTIKSNMNEDDKFNFLLNTFNQANIKVAQLCNHQKNVQKNFKEQITKLDEEIDKVKEDKSKEKKKSRISKLNNKIKKLKAKKELKLELKNISLGTSKINYIDPRITIAWIKKHEFPVEKIFSETLREKFKWAFEVDYDKFVY